MTSLDRGRQAQASKHSVDGRHPNGKHHTGPPPAADPPPVLGVRRVDQVTPTPVHWLWPGRIALGMINLLDGDPSLGKSTISIDVAARLTRGVPFHGCCDPVAPAAVAFLCSEDSAEHTVRPRLEAAGADLTKCFIVETMPAGDTTRPVVLPHDLPFVERFMLEHGVKLLVVDPVLGFVSGEIDTHKDQSIRSVLHAVKLAAERTGAAVLALRHLNKSGGGSALYRGGGSIAFTASARVVLTVGRNPDKRDERVLAVTKTNLARVPKSLAYDLETVKVGECEVSRVAWGAESELTADDILAQPGGPGRPGEPRGKAEGFLRRELAGGPVPSDELARRAEAEGINRTTLFRAKKDLGVRAKKGGFSGNWMWELGAEECQESHTPELWHPSAETPEKREECHEESHPGELWHSSATAPPASTPAGHPWDDDDRFFAALEAAGKKWGDAIAWLNTVHATTYRPAARFFTVTSEHRELAFAWLAGGAPESKKRSKR